MSIRNAADLADHEWLNPEDPGGDLLPAQTTEPTVVKVPVSNTQPEGTDDYSSSRVLFGQTPTIILGDDTERRKATVRNTGSIPVVVGKMSDVSSRSAFVLKPDANVEVTSWRQVYAAPLDPTTSAPAEVSVWAERNLT